MTVVGLAAALGLAAGCGSSSSSSGPSAASSGTLAVQLVDAPDPSVESVNVTIDRVEAHVNSDWVAIATNLGTTNLASLLTTQQVLGSITLPPGQYTQLRFFIGPEVTMTDVLGTHTMTIPSGDQTGIKIPLDYTVAAGRTTTVVLDFNIADSIVALGNGEYQMKPVIHAAIAEATGTISGMVTNKGGNGIQRATVTATLPPLAGSTDAPQVFTTLTDPDGKFKIWNLPPGTYSVDATWANKTATAPNVVVNAGQDTDAGTLSLK